MPVEIKELIIRVAVNDQQPNQPARPAKNGNRFGPATGPRYDQLLKLCLEQTQELLEQKKER